MSKWVRMHEVLALTFEEEQRFHRRVDRSAGKEACWAWKGALADVYGRMKVGGRTEGAHRIAFALARPKEWTRGAVSKVLHSCDNRRCCNPAHLRLGTPTQNNADMVARGRARGQKGTVSVPFLSQNIPGDITADEKEQ